MALVVTIVVLLILAGVSISLVVNNNGIIQRSKEARSKYGQAKDNEQAQMSGVSDWIDNQVGSNGGTKVNPTVPGWENKKDENSTINGGEGNANNPTIPAGYVPINTATSNWGDGSSAPTQDSVDHGLVIKDDNNNEWVWIPVPDVTVMCNTKNETEYILSGTSGDNAIKTKLYSKSEIISGITRNNPEDAGTSEYSEPNLLVGNGTDFDADNEYYGNILGELGTKEMLANVFVSEYKDMIESVEKYGGFYIGRYELSDEGVKKDKEVLVNKNWYDLYTACGDATKLQASQKVKTQMIWGCQWDVVCDFIANKGDKKDITDSRSWGNYNDSIEPANTGNYQKTQKKNTGSNENWKANNIYDLAGNCSEWTREAYGNEGRAIRSGNYNGYGKNSETPAISRIYDNPDKNNLETVRFKTYSNNKRLGFNDYNRITNKRINFLKVV